jgi:outer membrane protein assembly factor BamD (BamD/ComL family)
MKIRFVFAAVVSAAMMAACAGAPKEIPADLTASELVQRAQEASDQYNYAAATAYYEALRERFGSDPAIACAADYEIAFIQYKQKRYAEAKAGLESIVTRYTEEGGSSLPERYKVLATKLLDRISEIERK